MRGKRVAGCWLLVVGLSFVLCPLPSESADVVAAYRPGVPVTATNWPTMLTSTWTGTTSWAVGNLVSNELIDFSPARTNMPLVDANCVVLDGTDKLTVANPSAYNFGDEGFILSGRFNPADASGGFKTLQGQYDTSGAHRSWLLVRVYNHFSFYASADGSATVNAGSSSLDPMPVGSWCDYSVVKYGASLTYVVNGEVIRRTSSTLMPETLHASTKPYTIGDRNNGGIGIAAEMCDVSVEKFNQDEIGLYLLFGQSNAQGLGVGGRPSPLGDIQHHSYSCDCTQASTPTRTNDLLTDYDVYNASEIKFGSLVTEGSLGRKRIAIVKVSENGAGVAGQYGNTTTKGWLKSRNHMYPRLIAAYESAKTALEAEGYTVNVKGAWAIVGEDDCNYEDRANAFAANVTQLISDLRTDIGVDFPVAWCRKPIAMQTAPAPRVYTTTVRAQEDTLPSLISGLTIIDTDSATLQADDIHFTAAGHDLIAELVYADLSSTLGSSDTDVVSLHPMAGGLGMGLDEPDVSGSGNNGTWSTDDVASLRSGKQDEFFYNFVHGCSVVSNKYIPADQSNPTKDTDGNLLTNPSGLAHNNSESSIVIGSTTNSFENLLTNSISIVTNSAGLITQFWE